MNLKRLPVAPRLKTREWWGTYIWRLSIAGYFDPPSLLISHLRDILQIIEQHDSLDAPRKASTYKALSRLINQDMEAIYHSTIHSLSTILPVSKEGLDSLEIGEIQYTLLMGGFADVLLPNRALQYCPICLQDIGYVPMEWLFKLYPVCIHHQCILKAICPHCNGRLNAQDIQTQTCKQCAGNLVKTETIFIQKSDKAFLVSECIVEMIGRRNMPIYLKNTLPDDFTIQAVLSLMTLVFIWLSTNVVSEDWRAKTGLFRLASPINNDVSSAYYLSSVAFSILEDWPCRFYEFIDTLRLQHLGIRRLSYSGIDWLFYKWFLLHWNSPEYVALHRAFAPYFYKEINRNSHQEISQYNRFLRDKGYLDKYFSDKYTKWRNQNYITRAELSGFLGLSESILNDITTSRLIEKQPGVDGSDAELYSTFSAQSLLQRVRAVIRPVSEATDELISFETAISTDWKSSRLIRLVVLSELMAYTSSKSSQSYIHDLFFKSKDLDRLWGE